MGLLGFALHPNFAQNGYFFVNYTGQNGDTFISRFQANGNIAPASSELNLLRIKQPFPNHNGGSMAFGPDGYLYAGLGDGGASGDPPRAVLDACSEDPRLVWIRRPYADRHLGTNLGVWFAILANFL
jgi:glucose/arabinose dehydrogenase